MPNLSYRSKEKELIDDLELDNDALRQNLEELAVINKYLGGNQVTISGLSSLIFDVRDSRFDLEKNDDSSFLNVQPKTEHQTSKILQQPSNIENRATITIADLGCGGGDMLRLIDRWAKKKNKKVKLIGIDANTNIIAFAKEHKGTTFSW